MNKQLKISLKAARVNADLSQKEAAQRLKINVSTLQHYEKGITIPDWEIVKAMEKIYGIHSDYIFFKTESALSEMMQYI